MIKKEIGSFIKWYACVKYDLNSNLFIDWPFGKIKKQNDERKQNEKQRQCKGHRKSKAPTTARVIRRHFYIHSPSPSR